jgi:hypothetical protein
MALPQTRTITTVHFTSITIREGRGTADCELSNVLITKGHYLAKIWNTSNSDKYKTKQRE